MNQDDGGEDVLLKAEMDKALEQAKILQKAMFKNIWPMLLGLYMVSIGGVLIAVFGVLGLLKAFGVI